MSAQIPVEVRRHFSVKSEKDHWDLKCDVCPEKFRLEKPKKGEKIHSGNVLSLLNHAATHPIGEEASEDGPYMDSSPVAPTPAVVKPAPSKEVTQHVSIKHTLPSENAPNCYKVEMIGRNTKVSHFRDPLFRDHRVVKKTETGYTVVLYAANQKHASMVATRLIEQYRATK